MQSIPHGIALLFIQCKLFPAMLRRTTEKVHPGIFSMRGPSWSQPCEVSMTLGNQIYIKPAIYINANQSSLVLGPYALNSFCRGDTGPSDDHDQDELTRMGHGSMMT